MSKAEAEKQSHEETRSKEKLKSRYSNKTDRELLEAILSILEIRWRSDLE